MKSNIVKVVVSVKVVVGQGIYKLKRYWVTYSSGCTKSYRNIEVPETVLNFIEKGVIASKHINECGDETCTYIDPKRKERF